jgi:2,4-dienoyl-CoA reductase-like NADH-dependent reductase (Old Yellow Enzyme family)
MPDLFSPLTLRGLTLKNRIGVSPMCQYCCNDDGKPTEWHLVHLVPRAMGGAGLTIVEASAVTPEGRIAPGDVGLWGAQHIGPHEKLATAIARAGSVPGVQLAHAGRKAARGPGWVHAPADRPWEALGPSAVAFGDYATPKAMSEGDIAATIAAFGAAAKRAVAAGYRFVELHAAHGYLLHEFLSPLSNQRNDSWGGDFAGRSRMVLECARAVRAALPDDMPMSVRISHTDWVEGGWDTAQAVELARQLKALGADIIDVSSGGLDAGQKIPLGPGYQVPGAIAVRQGAEIAVAAVGLITEAAQANAIVVEGKADLVLLARVLLRDPYWPYRAAAALGRADAITAPPQYERGWSALGKVGMNQALGAPLEPL